MTSQADARPRTRRPDLLTDVFLGINLVLAVWAAVLIVLTLGGITQAGYYTLEKAEIKAIGATVVALLAISQLYTMEASLGHLPRGSIRIRYLMRTHRFGGRIALVLAALIAYFCITDVGAPTDPLRPFLHAVFGASAFSAIGIKLALIRFRPHAAYNLAPWLGRYAVLAFCAIWATSAYAYFSGTL